MSFADYDKCHYAECHVCIVMLSTVILNVVMLSVIILNVIMLNVVAPPFKQSVPLNRTFLNKDGQISLFSPFFISDKKSSAVLSSYSSAKNERSLLQ